MAKQLKYQDEAARAIKALRLFEQQGGTARFHRTVGEFGDLEFRIHLKPPPGSPDSEIVRTATQEIEVKDGVPNVLQSP